MTRTVRILGTRGVPGRHGGFETFAERLALFLAARGWEVIVYCQEEGEGPIEQDVWHGIRRIRIPVKGNGAASTIAFDWACIQHAARTPQLCLTLGYNTAVFCARLRLAGIPNVINMDGVEWARAKWGPLAKAWFYLNESLALRLGNHLIADHPEIRRYLTARTSSNRVTTIPYGADALDAVTDAPIQAVGLYSQGYATVIARPEPENSILEIVQAFSESPRAVDLVVLGSFSDEHRYHVAVRRAAGPQVHFLGAIYDRPILQSLRFHAAFHIHGHQVGGTNPSLVEALGAGNAVICHDNVFNRWVADDAALYFESTEDLAARLEQLFESTELVTRLASAARKRARTLFTWNRVLTSYESLLIQHVPETMESFDLSTATTEH